MPGDQGLPLPAIKPDSLSVGCCFRDYLRQHEDVAAEYAVLKRRLADQFSYDGDRYTSEKSASISDIVGRAPEGKLGRCHLRGMPKQRSQSGAVSRSD